ncbi:hypothetical protein C8Q80DRAFT_163208 [Daedaleopsis nitida]|nr:hypothetical protein C8Q80DRAFT_163208 [Daedaleopsis nitida]
MTDYLLELGEIRGLQREEKLCSPRETQREPRMRPSRGEGRDYLASSRYGTAVVQPGNLMFTQSKLYTSRCVQCELHRMTAQPLTLSGSLMSSRFKSLTVFPVSRVLNGREFSPLVRKSAMFIHRCPNASCVPIPISTLQDERDKPCPSGPLSTACPLASDHLRYMLGTRIPEICVTRRVQRGETDILMWAEEMCEGEKLNVL